MNKLIDFWVSREIQKNISTGYDYLPGGNIVNIRKCQSIGKYSIVALTQSFLFLLLVALYPALASIPESQHKLLQMTTVGHVLGFDHNAVFFASGDHMLKVEFAKTNGVKPIGKGFVGDDSASQPIKQVVYSAIWPGIDLVYDVVDNGIVESTWKIAEGINPDQIRLQYNRPVSIDDSGNLKVNFKAYC